ncbi:TPA_asm: G [Betula betacytorhabdovirus 1]|nr:TPA_asm: G [Betula betacytorhabdovirus 1]
MGFSNNTVFMFKILSWMIYVMLLNLSSTNSVLIELKSDHALHLLPLVKCQPNGVDISTVSKMCIEQCPRSESKAEVKNMRVLDKVQPFNKISIFICHTYEESWRFDESWLFSKTKNLQLRRNIPVNETECRRLLTNVCHDIPCKTMSVLENIEEYNYASSIVKTYTYSNGASVNVTAIVMDKNDLFLHGLPGITAEIDIKSGKAISTDLLSGYFWNPVDFSDCPIRKWQVTQCLVQPSKSIICPDLGLNIWEPKTIKIKHCENREFFYDDKNILLEYAPSAERLMRARYIELDNQLSAKESNIVSMTNEALRVRDELTCDHQCLELSNVKHQEDTVLSTSNSFWRYSMGKLHECTPLYNCDFEKGVTVCQDPMSVSMNCMNEIVSWDPEKDYANFPSPCHAKRARVSEYRMRTKQGIISFNSSGAYLEIPEEHMLHIKHMSPHISSLKSHSVQDYISIIDSKSSSVNDKSELVSVSKTASWKSVLSIPSSIIEWVEDAENDIKKVITIFIGFIIIVALVLILRRKNRNYISTPVSKSKFNQISYNRYDSSGEIYEI